MVDKILTDQPLAPSSEGETPVPLSISDGLPNSTSQSDGRTSAPPSSGSDPVIPTWRLVVLGISLSVGLFLSLMDATIVATALFQIGEDFKQLTSVTWVALAYTLAYVGCAVLFTRISDVIGRRNAYTAANAIFIAFSIGCGLAKNLNQLIACRAVQGIGGSGLYSLTMVIFPEITPLRLRPSIGAVVGLIIAVAGVLGPVVGGLITHYSTWPWIFFINAPVGILPAIALHFVWPTASQMYPAKRRSIKEIDFIGCVLLLAATVLVVFAFQQGGLGSTNQIWHSALFIAPLVVGCICWIALIGWETVVQRLLSIPPLLPINLLRQRVYLSGVLCTITTGYVYFTLIYTLPIHIQIVNQKSALLAGIDLLPMLGSAAVGSMAGGYLNAKKNNIFPIMLFGASLMAIGSGLFSTVDGLTLEPKVYGYQVLIGLGFGLAVSNATMLAIIESGLDEHAVAQGVVAQARVLGGSIGIAASTAILGATQRREIASAHQSAATGSAVQTLAVRQAYADAFQRTMQVAAVIACVTVVLTVGTWQRHPLTMAERAKQLHIEKAKLARAQLAGRGGVEKC
ncbi:Hypothetical protein R9X50_00537100 [Acrodontium crateriforme]|uniref:Major facilitator superfamily (MFS) profile domain-containing protein n=1 Tax=Acrodontium crateriforme TaxID=150365 RepID=A0AAQ3RAT6_9PEZI|nr:Hypothetical protein R9X50_00537100 [Acrodontium crateriforme]